MGTVGVVGGGVAGLAAAHYILRKPSVTRLRVDSETKTLTKDIARVVILEASPRLGGWVKTTRHRDGIIYEAGPRTIRPAGQPGANTLALVQELGMEDLVRPVKYGSPSASTRLVVADGALHKLPSSFGSLFKTLTPFQRPLAFALIQDLMSLKHVSEDESLHDFILRRLGPDIANYAVAPLVRGICAGDSRQMSVHFIASYLHSLEQSSGRISLGFAKDWIKGKVSSGATTPEENCDLVKKARAERWAVWGLAGGLETLTERWAESLQSRGVEIKLNSPVESLEMEKTGSGVCRGKIALSTKDDTLLCDNVVLAAPSFTTSRLVAPLHPELAATLASIPFVDVAVANLEYLGRDVQGDKGFGFLVPPTQPEPILGCIYDTCTFAQGNRTIFTVMMGGAWYKQMVGSKNEREVAEVAQETVQKLLGFTATPQRTATSLLSQCIAQYTVGHRNRVAKARQLIKDDCPGLSIVGSSYDGVGINDTILSSKTQVSNL